MAERPKLNDLGGPILGAIGKIMFRGARGPSEGIMGYFRDLNDRYRGRMADRARRTGSFTAQIASGRRFPTARAEAQMFQRGDAWAIDRNNLAGGAATREHDVAFQRGGVVAGKAALVERAGSDRRGDLQRRTAEQSVIQLVGSSSWVELQNSVIQQGRNQGKRITQVQVWQDTLSNAQFNREHNLWGNVSRVRPDLTPDVIQAAEQHLGYRYDDTPASQPHLLDSLDLHCLQTAISRFDALSLQHLHQGIFEEIARLGDPALSQQLYDVLHTFRHAPGTIGADAIGSLAGARSVAIDAALAPIHQSYASI